MAMEIEIQSKTENPLLKRTEVHFKILHTEEKTPKRELVKSELADKLSVKKENIIINFMESNFGAAETTGYAKIYSSLKEAKNCEEEHILKRNNAFEGEKKQEKPKEEPSKEKSGKEANKPEEQVKEEKPAEPTTDDTKDKKTDEEPKQSEEKLKDEKPSEKQSNEETKPEKQVKEEKPAEEQKKE